MWASKPIIKYILDKLMYVSVKTKLGWILHGLVLVEWSGRQL